MRSVSHCSLGLALVGIGWGLAGASLAADPASSYSSAVTAALSEAPTAKVGSTVAPTSALQTGGFSVPVAQLIVGPDVATMRAVLAAEPRPQPGTASLIPSGLSQLHVELTTADGRVFKVTEGDRGLTLLADNGYVLTMGLSSLTDRRPAYQFAYRLALKDGGVSVSTVFALAQGDVIQPPAVLISTEGGSRTIDLADGGSLTLTLDGAHPVSQAEQDHAVQMNERAAARR